MDYRIDNKFYLKDFKYHKENKDNNINIDMYSDTSEKLNLVIIFKNGNIYIKNKDDDKIEVIDNSSNIELVNDNYKKLDKSVYEKYSFDFDTAIGEFRYKKFEHYDREWLTFIVASRSGKKVWRDYDIIEGGVANDKVIDTVEAFIAGQIDEDKALGELSKHQPNNQICILKQKIIDKYLFFEKSTKLK